MNRSHSKLNPIPRNIIAAIKNYSPPEGHRISEIGEVVPERGDCRMPLRQLVMLFDTSTRSRQRRFRLALQRHCKVGRVNGINCVSVLRKAHDWDQSIDVSTRQAIAQQTIRLRKRSNSKPALSRKLERIWREYWQMEFPSLEGTTTNPFRVHAYIGPDSFCDSEAPMNLTHIQTKIQEKRYTNIYQFFVDIDRMIDNVLKYYENNVGKEGKADPYYRAFQELKKKHRTIVVREYKQSQM